jgi:hypothetical protein
VRTQKTKEQLAEEYRAHRENMAQRMRDKYAAASDIGDIPKPADPVRRAEAESSLRAFCEIYRPSAFHMGWSEDHLRVIERIETTARSGGLFALAMPRGSGKTTISITSATWALLTGLRRWLCLIGATEPKAQKLLDGIKSELRFNPLLLADFPEVCLPIVKLEGKTARTNGQTYQGQPTSIKWLADNLRLPTIEGSRASGSIVSVCGITGDVRGQQETLPSGDVIRPDYVLLDDPQTRESAKSATQTDDRLAIVNGDVLGLSGPKVKIAGVMACTVISRGDLADQSLDRAKSPEWHGERTQILYGMPTNMDLWNRYQEIREACFRNGSDTSEATAFYRDNQAAMDEGSRPAWPDRFNEDEISAVQNCMNLYFRDEAAFWAEYQNQPLEIKADDRILSEDEITKRTGSTGRGILPSNSTKLVAFVDVQQELLFYAVAAFRDDFTAAVVEYGAYPGQRTTNFRMQNVRNNFSKLWPGESLEAKLAKALKAIEDQIIHRRWKTEDGLELPVSRMMIDANWGLSRNIVYQFCQGSGSRSILFPSHGRGVGASSDPLNAHHTRKMGRAVGSHWRIDRAKDSPIRHVLFDANYWKSFLHSRLATEPGTPGSLTLYQASPLEHETIAKHLRAEYAVRTEGKGRTVDEWKIKPDRPDNHWLDCLVGCCVAASMEGCKLPSDAGPKRKRSAAMPSPNAGDQPAQPETTKPDQPPPRRDRGRVSYL